ncbi:MAG: electron transporter RnfD, partial [Pedobacter sp.]|nr:electron transporter RnfD [Pedobacter sp.]
FHNNYKTYGVITARHFNAQYHGTAKSGIGIMVSWFKETMPDIYDLLDPKNPKSKWDFSKYKPDIVVVNLFQNDSYLVTLPEHEQYKARFGTQKPTEDFYITSYMDFIRSVRAKYPKAQIICCLGSMGAVKPGSKWPGYIDEAVKRLKDDKVVTHFFEYKGSDDHPKVKAQQAMADSLIAFIEEKGYFN